MEEISIDRLNTMVNASQSTYIARRAMIFYESDMEFKSHDAYGNTSLADRIRNFVTIHDIRDGEVCQGAPISRSVLEELVKQLVPSISAPTLIPQNLIMLQPGIGMAWWIPSGTRTLYFSKDTKISSGKAPIPALLFLVRDHNLYMWALGSDRRPAGTDPVYYAPFLNLSGGHLCTGNVRLPDMTVGNIPKWQDVVFKSRFSNHGGVRLKGTSMKGLWDSLIGKNIKKFPMKHLVKAGTLQSVLDLNRRGA